MLQSLSVLIVLTLVSGLADAFGFAQAARVWQGNQFMWMAAAKSSAGFAVGIPLYWWIVRLLQGHGIDAPELQAGGYFAVTIIMVALFSGRFMSWAWPDKLVAIAVLVGLSWLAMRIEF